MQPAPRVLVVEDEALVAMDVEQALQDAGCHTVWCSTREQAMMQLAAETSAGTLDAVVTDGRLRRQSDGAELVAHIHAHYPGLPVIAYSAQRQDYWQEFLPHPAFRRVDKLAGPDAMVQTLIPLLSACKAVRKVA